VEVGKEKKKPVDNIWGTAKSWKARKMILISNKFHRPSFEKDGATLSALVVNIIGTEPCANPLSACKPILGKPTMVARYPVRRVPRLSKLALAPQTLETVDFPGHHCTSAWAACKRI
jgi:hypothetical protein